MYSYCIGRYVFVRAETILRKSLKRTSKNIIALSKPYNTRGMSECVNDLKGTYNHNDDAYCNIMFVYGHHYNI